MTELHNLTGNYGRDLLVKQVDYSWLEHNCHKIDQLALNQEEPTPFSTGAWLKAWWDTFSTGYQLILIAVTDSDELCGFFPLMKSKVANTFVVLEWLATGRSDHAPLIVRHDSEKQVLSLVSEYIMNHIDHWHIISFRALQPEQANTLKSFFDKNYLHIVQDDVSPVFKINGTWEEYLMSKSKRHRGNLRRLIKNAKEIENIEVKCVSYIDDKLLQEISEVEKKSWKGIHGNLRMSGQGYKFFYSMLSEFSKSGVLELWICRYRDQIISYIITFNFANRIYFYNGAYMDNYKSLNIPKKISPGSLLITEAMKSAHDRCLKSFDFLRGEEGYKDGWSSENRNLYQFVIRNNGIKSYLTYFLLYRFRWWLRRYPFAQKTWEFIKSSHD